MDFAKISQRTPSERCGGHTFYIENVTEHLSDAVRHQLYRLNSVVTIY